MPPTSPELFYHLDLVFGFCSWFLPLPARAAPPPAACRPQHPRVDGSRLCKSPMTVLPFTNPPTARRGPAPEDRHLRRRVLVPGCPAGGVHTPGAGADAAVQPARHPQEPHRRPFLLAAGLRDRHRADGKPGEAPPSAQAPPRPRWPTWSVAAHLPPRREQGGVLGLFPGAWVACPLQFPSPSGGKPAPGPSTWAPCLLSGGDAASGGLRGAGAPCAPALPLLTQTLVRLSSLTVTCETPGSPELSQEPGDVPTGQRRPPRAS